jgi:glutathione S-transferase
MKLYYSKGACSLAVHIVINEIGIDCEYESVDLKTKVTETNADYWKINPKGAVPALRVNATEVLTENSIIQQYLADTFNAATLLPPLTEFERYRVLEWLNYISTELHKGFGPVFNDKVPADEKQSLFIPLLQKKFAFINTHLKNRKFIMGEHFTLPDAYLFVMLMWAEKLKFDMSDKPELNRYYDGLKKRASIVKSFQEEGMTIAV